MKKLVALIVFLILAVVALPYILIPSRLMVNDFETVPCSLTAANRVLSNPSSWEKFWGTDTVSAMHPFVRERSGFIVQEDTFGITKVLQNGLQITVANNHIKAGSTFMLLPLSLDSIVLNWSFETVASSNPVMRVRQYYAALHLKKNMDAILKNMKDHLGQNEKMYGISIEQTSTVDTSLISTRKEFPHHPTIEELYAMIDKLKAYAMANRANAINAPMMNITQNDSTHFSAMLALPVDKKLADKGDISYKKLIPGMFLTTTVTGGSAAVGSAERGMQQYFQDYKRTAMAIPFQYLLTDRRSITDTSKWVTKLYFPVY